jgi:hypothetical protein
MLRYRLHPSGLIALRACSFTLSLLSFFPFSFEKSLSGQRAEKESEQKLFII